MAEVPGIRRVEMIMGMPIVVDVRDDGAGDELLDRAFDWFREVDAVFSTYKDDSEISRLNRDELALRECREDVRRVIARCRELVDETEGYFDAEAVVPGTIDPSGLVKGWSVDRAAALLDGAGVRELRRERRRRHPAARRRAARRRAGASASSTRRSATGSRRSSRATISRSRPRASTRAASTSSTRTRAARRRACSR